MAACWWHATAHCSTCNDMRFSHVAGDGTQQLLLGPQPMIAIGSSATQGWEELHRLGYSRCA